MATKKAAKKTAKAAKTNGGRRGASYSLASKNIPEVKGQALLILNTLKKKQPMTMSEIAAAVGGQLKTKQEPIAVVNHYIGKLKADGVVKVAKAA